MASQFGFGKFWLRPVAAVTHHDGVMQQSFEVGAQPVIQQGLDINAVWDESV